MKRVVEFFGATEDGVQFSDSIVNSEDDVGDYLYSVWWT
jgi:hypothetical protein